MVRRVACRSVRRFARGFGVAAHDNTVELQEVKPTDFVPNAANIWPVTLSCYDDGTGHSIYVFYDDGQKVSG